MASEHELSAPAPSRTATEIATQPALWRRAVSAAGEAAGLPQPGERVAVTGCGTSWFMAQAYAALREAAGLGETDAYPASEFPAGRSYDRVLAISRSGTTTEVLRLLEGLRGEVPSTVLTADGGAPVVRAAGEAVVLDWADEESVVQTRFATSALAVLRAAMERQGELPGGVKTVEEAAVDCDLAVGEPLPAAVCAAEQLTFLGRGWTYGLAQEAALKLREASGAWTEAYPAMEYRHGPMSVAGAGRVVWVLGALPEGLAAEVASAKGLVESASGPGRLDPMADLVRAQRVAVARAEADNLDPDRPRNLARSVILE